jgi:thiamine kinase-like enzyme
MLTPEMADYEIERGTQDPVPNMIPGAWRRMADESPAAARILRPLVDNPFPLVAALERGPQTLVHSDWKAGNLGSHPDGRTVVLDWAFPGAAPPAIDLGWYLAVNCDLLPHSKEEAISAYHESLCSTGVDTTEWWEPQLELGLLASLFVLGWSKTGDELAWWVDRAERAIAYVDN